METRRSLGATRIGAILSWAVLLAVATVLTGGCSSTRMMAGKSREGGLLGLRFAQDVDEFRTGLESPAEVAGTAGRPVRGVAAGRRMAEAAFAEAAPAAPPVEGREAVAAPAPIPGGEGEKQAPPIATPPKGQKRLDIYTANFAILVSNVEDSMKELLKKIEGWEGYVQTADLKRVTFRVPAAAFDRAVEEISKMGVVTNKQIQAEDVTRAFADLQLRIEVAEKSRKRMLDLLEKAQKTEDLLKIENEIRRLTEEIERMQAELRTLADRIAYSTITVELTAKAAEVKRPRPSRAGSYFPWINQIGADNVSRNF